PTHGPERSRTVGFQLAPGGFSNAVCSCWGHVGTPFDLAHGEWMMGFDDDYGRSMRRFSEVSQLARVANELSEAVRMSRMSSTFDDMRELLRIIPPQSLMPPIGLPPEALNSLRQ